MQRKSLLASALAAVMVLAAACEKDPAGIAPDGQLTRAEALALAPEYDLVAGTVMDGLNGPSFSVTDEGSPLAAVTHTTTFTRTATCPQGGATTLAGTHVATVDRDAQTASSHFEATRTDAACAFQRRGGAVITITGNPNIALTADASVSATQPLKRTATQKGGFTWTRSTGESGTCTVDLTSTWDRATHTHTVKGTFCGHTIDVTRTHSGGGSHAG